MSVVGGRSKGERNRVKIRVRTAMAAQAQIEGRFLGGRPPYRYTLADARPHPTREARAPVRRASGSSSDYTNTRALNRPGHWRITWARRFQSTWI